MVPRRHRRRDIELKASPDGANLYAALGFRSTTDPTLRLIITNE